MKSYFIKIYNLVKHDIKSKSGMNANAGDKKTKIKKIMAYLGIAVLIIYLGGLGYVFAEKMIKTFQEAGMINQFITTLMFIAHFLIFFTAFSALISNKNADNSEKYIDKLPVSSKQRYIAKNITQVLSAYSATAIAISVPIIYFGVSQGAGVAYYLRCIFAFLFMPVLPTLILFAIFSLLKAILDYLTKGKSENVISIVFIAFIGVLYFVIYSKMAEYGNFETAFMEYSSKFRNNNLKILTYFPNKFSEIVIGKDVLKNILLILGINIGAITIFANTIGNMYQAKTGLFGKFLEKINFFKKQKEQEEKINIKNENKLEEKENNKIEAGIASVEVEHEKNNKSNEDKIWNELNLKDKDFKQKPKVKAYVQREFSTFSRNINLAISTLFTPIIIPLLMIIIMSALFIGEMSQVLKSKDKMYLLTNIKIEDILNSEEMKNDPKLKEAVEKILKEDVSYYFDNETSVKTKQKNSLSDRYESMREEAETEEEKKIFNYIYEAVKKSEENDKNEVKFMLGKFSFEGIEDNEEKVENKILGNIKKLQEEGKIEKISEDEKKEQKENPELQKYAKYELPTNLVKSYNDTKEILSSKSVYDLMKNNIIKIRGKIKYSDAPKPLQFAIPIFVTAFIIYSLSMSIFMFSKDKNEIAFLKRIPISYDAQIKYKQLPGIITTFTAVVCYLIIPNLIFGMGMLKSIYFILGLIMSIIIIVMFNNLEILLDLVNPNFGWTDTKDLLKGQSKAFVIILIKIIVIFAVGFSAYYFVSMKKLISIEKYIICVSAIIVALSIALEVLLLKVGPKKFAKL